MESREKIIEKIRKLLALSNSPNQAEAESAMRFAQKLMEQYRIESTDIEMGEVDSVVLSQGQGRVKLTVWQTILLNGIARSNFCTFIITKSFTGFDTRRRKMFVRSRLLVGRQVNLLATQLMYDYVVEVGFRLAKRYTGASDRNSFLNGFADGVFMQLEKSKEQWGVEEQEALVLTGDRLFKENKKFLDQQGMRIKKDDSGLSRSLNKNYHSGFKKGNTLSLNRQVNGQQKMIGAPA